MKWPVEQANRHGETRHRLEDALEIGLLDRQQLVEKLAPLGLRVGHHHVAGDQKSLVVAKHVLGAAEPDAPRAELACLCCFCRRVGVRANIEPADRVGPAEHRVERLGHRRRNERHGAGNDLAGRSVNRERVSLGERARTNRQCALGEVDMEFFATNDAGRAHAARHDGGMRGEPAARSQDSSRREHSVEVVRRRLPAHENHVFASAPSRLGQVRIEDDRARRGARRRVQAACHDFVGRADVNGRVQQLVELGRVDACDRFFLADQVLGHHVNSDTERGLSRSLCPCASAAGRAHHPRR